MTIHSGPYRGTWNSLAIGLVLDGFNMSYSNRARKLTTDSLGETGLDYLHAGQDMFVDFVVQEYDAAALQTMMWHQNAVFGMADRAGYSLWDRAKTLVLTACTGASSPETPSPATATFFKTILAPDFDISIALANRERYIPIRLLVLPVHAQQGTANDPTTTPSVYTSGGAYARPGAVSGVADDCNDIGYFAFA
jgi:hypothetical protein